MWPGVSSTSISPQPADSVSPSRNPIVGGEVGVHAFAAAERARGRERGHHRAAAPVGRARGQDRRAGRCGQRTGEGGMVAVRMGDEDRADPFAGRQGRQDRGQMAGRDRGRGRSPPPRPRRGDRCWCRERSSARGWARSAAAAPVPAPPRRFRFPSPVPARLSGPMDFGWLKRMLPRGLYGRAALILLVPIVTLQIVVSGQILQRYFRGCGGADDQRRWSLDLALVRDQIVDGRPGGGDGRGAADRHRARARTALPKTAGCSTT